MDWEKEAVAWVTEHGRAGGSSIATAKAFIAGARAAQAECEALRIQVNLRLAAEDVLRSQLSLALEREGKWKHAFEVALYGLSQANPIIHDAVKAEFAELLAKPE